jgi:hypothetical protein
MTYQELHKQVIDHLRELGIWHKYEDRIALFWYRHNIKYVVPPEVKDLTAVVADIDKLINMRKEGLEPAHANGAYIDTGRTSSDVKGETKEG